jgi:hypothetical protein
MEFTDITPEAFRCSVSMACPSVMEDGGDLIIIGAKLDEPVPAEILDRIGHGETAVRISRELVEATVLQTALHDITGITLGDEIADKITEDQAIRLINSVLAALRQTHSARPTFKEQVTNAGSTKPAGAL